MLRGLCLVDKHHLCRLVHSYLAHHLGTYATCRTRNEHLLATEQDTYLLHIHLNLVTRKEVLDIDLTHNNLLLVVLILVPLLGVLCYVDAHTSVDKEILQLAVVQEHIVLKRTYKHSLDVLGLDNLKQILLCRVYVLAHKTLLVVGLAVADISLYEEAYRLVAASLVSHGYSTCVCAVDKHVLGILADENILEDNANKNTRTSHKGCCEDIYYGYLATCQREEDVVPTEAKHRIVEQQSQYH